MKSSATILYNRSPYAYGLVALIVQSESGSMSEKDLRQGLARRSLQLLACVEYGIEHRDSRHFIKLDGQRGRCNHCYLCICFHGRPRFLPNDPASLRFENSLAHRIALSPQLAPNGVPGTKNFSLRVLGITPTTRAAWSVVSSELGPTVYSELRDAVLTLIEESIPPFPVIQHMGGRGLYSRTDLVSYANRRVICKTFSSSAGHRFEAEVEGLQLSAKFTFIPKLVEVGSQWVLMEYYERYEHISINKLHVFNLRVLRNVFGALKALHDEGYSLLDFAPHNILQGPDGDIKFIDFEHLFRYSLFEPDFYSSPAIIGSEFFKGAGRVYLESDNADPKWFETKLPTYDRVWRRYAGLSAEQLLQDSAVRQQLRRALFVVGNRFPQVLARSLPGTGPSKIG